ncbi:hypothetical protein SNEBB_009509 [Seison nebaliae]|nr:hypothetical protein SNEBB_009509 [Seison nebaliae]
MLGDDTYQMGISRVLLWTIVLYFIPSIHTNKTLKHEMCIKPTFFDTVRWHLPLSSGCMYSLKELSEADRELKWARDNLIFGQPVVTILTRQIIRHWSTCRERPLIVTMFGSTGIGKSYTCRIIADALYVGGRESANVHVYSATQHFQYVENMDKMKDNLRNEILEKVQNCPFSLFIFDEIDKMPTTFLDIIKPMVETVNLKYSLMFSRAIFILISNGGGSCMFKLSKKWNMEDLKEDNLLAFYKEFSNCIVDNNYNSPIGALSKSALLRHSIIDLHVPYLPLGREDVAKCIEMECLKRKMVCGEETVKKILVSLTWHPVTNPKYSMYGCKEIESLLAFHQHQNAIDDNDDNEDMITDEL